MSTNTSTSSREKSPSSLINEFSNCETWSWSWKRNWVKRKTNNSRLTKLACLAKLFLIRCNFLHVFLFLQTLRAHILPLTNVAFNKGGDKWVAVLFEEIVAQGADIPVKRKRLFWVCESMEITTSFNNNSKLKMLLSWSRDQIHENETLYFWFKWRNQHFFIAQILVVKWYVLTPAENGISGIFLVNWCLKIVQDFSLMIVTKDINYTAQEYTTCRLCTCKSNH